MNREQMCQIASWIKTYPRHYYGSESDTPAQAYFRFMSNQSLIIEYEDPRNEVMFGDQIPNGCTYIFKEGISRQKRCNCAPVQGYSRCSFHNHTIFSDEIREEIAWQHVEINNNSSPRQRVPSSVHRRRASSSSSPRSIPKLKFSSSPRSESKMKITPRSDSKLEITPRELTAPNSARSDSKMKITNHRKSAPNSSRSDSGLISHQPSPPDSPRY